MKVVLNGENLVEALTTDTGNVLEVLVKVCDRIVLNELIRQEYHRNKAFSNVLPQLERLNERLPPKVVQLRTHRQPNIPLPKHHRRLIEGAIASEADILIANLTLRGRWADLARDLQQIYRLRILSPDSYVTGKSPVQ